MPVTSFVILIVSVLAASALTVWAMSEWGVLNVLPVLILLGLATRWGLSHDPADDGPA